ncbi:hypothetical protein [Magnetospirillum sulfuroxidans]|uniref:Uncharacterized protein n=1 Tax=Magnetospirillum sulfuroxidans TaxID=611300 RepID=A0ABS5IFY2_9PROT|nr:hypothetical protein [Magnetospirillum sulfuroxidans]MBR9973092.1 hypothetical protein [Magnetospirillum sulfuroxidans]
MLTVALLLVVVLSAGIFISGHFLGLRQAVGILVVAAVSSSALQFVLSHISGQGWGFAAMALVVGVVLGGGAVSLRRFFAVGPRPREVLREFWRDKRKLVVVAACAAAAILTLFFAQLSVEKALFWPGFYQSWTAGFVAFMLFGVATTVASLAKPEDDDFDRRVRILFGGQTGRHIDYIAGAVAKVGYYADLIERVYCIEQMDFTQDCYLMSVSHRASIRHYIRDVASTEFLEFSYVPDLVPGQNPVGHLISVTVTGADGVVRKKVGAAGLPILPQAGIDEKWSIDIGKGETINVEVKFRVWCKLGENEVFDPARFAKKIETKIERTCNGPDVTLKCKVRGVEIVYPLSSGGVVKIPVVDDCSPEENAYSFRLEVSSSASGVASALP